MTRQTLRYWSKEEIDFLRDNLNKLKICEIAQELKRPIASVRAKALRLKRGIGHFKAGPVWTEVKLTFLKENYKRMSRKELAQQLGTTLVAVKAALAAYNIKKFDYQPTPELLSEAQRGYIAGVLDADGSILVTKGYHKVYGTYLRPYLNLGTMTCLEVPSTIYGWLISCNFVPTKRIRKRGRLKIDVYDLLLRRRNEIIVLLNVIKHHLIGKKQHAEMLLAFCQATTQDEKWQHYKELQGLIPESMQRRKK